MDFYSGASSLLFYSIGARPWPMGTLLRVTDTTEIQAVVNDAWSELAMVGYSNVPRWVKPRAAANNTDSSQWTLASPQTRRRRRAYLTKLFGSRKADTLSCFPWCRLLRLVSSI